MPEIKNTFTQGKMNKDLDERIIPNGQYRDALNVKVSVSDDSSVGTVQNVLGNERLESIVPATYKCVGSISNEKTNKLYWFVTKTNVKDAILEYNLNTSETKLVLVDTKANTSEAVLKFTDKIITGINIIDNLLFFTDGISEPKKINIDSCIAGTTTTTDLDTATHTKLIVNGVDEGDIKESHITVIRKNPKSQLDVIINKPTTQTSTQLFEKIFPRFSCRYKYRDGEYSAFGPFTNVVFNASYNADYSSGDAYSAIESYNTAMVNNISSIELKNFRTSHTPKDVVQIEILYKQEGSNVVFSIKKINYDTDPSSDWTNNSCLIKSETIYAALPENQILRVFDAVPTKALAQEITGNRLVYGNYTQGYDAVNPRGFSIEKAFDSQYGVFDVDYNIRETNKSFSEGGIESVKSQRKYQVGFVLGDKYGRETPVFTSDKGFVEIPWFNYEKPDVGLSASKALQIVAKTPFQKNSIQISPPSWADYYKYYIKETSSEYYNLVMDKAYIPSRLNIFDNEEDHIWISFPSSDRSKVDEENYLILKKLVGASENQVSLENKFKILDISNEAPDQIKFNYLAIGQAAQNTIGGSDFLTNNTTGLMRNSTYRIDQETDMVYVRRDAWINDCAGGSLTDDDNNDNMYIDNMYMSFENNVDNVETSEKYKVISIVHVTDVYRVKLNRKITQKDAQLADVNGVANDTSSGLKGDLVLKFERKEQKDLDEFSGKFFVKIVASRPAVNNIENNVAPNLISNYIVTTKRPLRWYVESADGISDPTTGLINGSYPAVASPHNKLNDINGGATLTNTEDAWNLVLTENSGYAGSNYDGSSKTFFIDNAYFVAGQSDISNYARQSGQTYRGSYVQYNPELVWDQSSGGWSTYAFDSKPLYYNSETGHSGEIVIDKDINGLEGYLQATGPSHVNTDQDGYRVWLKGKIQDRFDFDYNVYSQNDGKHYLHISFLAPGVNLHGGWSGLGITTSSPLTGPNSISAALQGIWGGGYFSENGQALFMEGNYDAAGNALLNPPAPGVGQGYDSAYKDQHENQWNPAYPENATTNPNFELIKDIVDQLKKGSKFKFSNDTQNTVIEIISDVTVKKLYNHTPWRAYKAWDGVSSTNNGTNIVADNIVLGGNSVEEAAVAWVQDTNDNPKLNTLKERIRQFGDASNRRVTYIFEIDQDISSLLPLNSDLFDSDGDGSNPLVNIEFLSKDPNVLIGEIKDKAAIWETEPKFDEGLDIYYEASSAYPFNINEETNELLAPIGSRVEFLFEDAINGTVIINRDNFIQSWIDAKTFEVTYGFNAFDSSGNIIDYGNKKVRIFKEDGSFVTLQTATHITPPNVGVNFHTVFTLQDIISGGLEFGLNWSNCFSFGNGIESNRIRDDFNAPQISNGVKASITLEQDYKEEHRKSGLIYSEIYNSTSSVNNLNQFIAAQKITKDLNPTYGSIQKLFQRRISLIAFCEDRVVSITSNKDALFNADGNPQLISSTNVLGDATPFVGDYGISKNPESFAKESYRAYFTDKQRGAVLRLSMDGLTPISEAGMADYFRDNLKLTDNLIGSYDNHNKYYNLTIAQPTPSLNLITNGTFSTGNPAVIAPSIELITDGNVNNVTPLTYPIIDNIADNIVFNQLLESRTDIVNYDEIPQYSLLPETTSGSTTIVNNYTTFATGGFGNQYYAMALSGGVNPFDSNNNGQDNYIALHHFNSLTNYNVNNNFFAANMDLHQYPDYGGGQTDSSYTGDWWAGATNADFGASGDVFWNPTGLSYTGLYNGGVKSTGNPWFYDTDMNGIIIDGLGQPFGGFAMLPGDRDADGNANVSNLPNNVSTKYPNARDNTIFNGEEVRLLFYFKHPEDFDGTGPHSRNVVISLYDGATTNGVAVNDANLLDPNTTSLTDPNYSTYHVTPTISDFQVGYQTTATYNFPVDITGNNNLHEVYFKFTDGTEDEGIVVQDLQFAIGVNAGSGGAYGVIGSLNIRKVFRMETAYEETIIPGSPQGDGIPSTTVPAFASVVHDIIDWETGESGGSFLNDHNAKHAVVTYGPEHTSEIISETRQGQTISYRVPPGSYIDGSSNNLVIGTVSNGVVVYNDGSGGANMYIDGFTPAIDDTIILLDNAEYNIEGIPSVPFIQDNYYVLDILFNSGTISNPNANQIGLNSSGTSLGVVDPIPVTYDDFYDGPTDVIRFFFQADGLINQQFTLNFEDIGIEITQINLIDVTATYSGGNALNWAGSVSPGQNYFSVPSVYADVNNGFVFSNEINSGDLVFQGVAGLTTATTSGYQLTFEISNYSLGKLSLYIAGDNEAYTYNDIDQDGVYTIDFNLDGSGGNVLLNGAQHGVLNTVAVSNANVIAFSPDNVVDFAGNLDNISLQDQTVIFSSGGSANSFNISGFDSTINNYIDYDDINENIVFSNAPLSTPPVQLEQIISNNLGTGDSYRLSFNHNNIVGSIEGYYFNSNGDGFRFTIPSGTSYFNQTFVIGDATINTPELSNTLVFAVAANSTSGSIDNVSLQQVFSNFESSTVSYSERVRGWVSFKSFVLEQGVSLSSNYYTFKNGGMWKHSSESVGRANFYGLPYESSITAILNEAPSIIKNFNTLNYEGSQAKITKENTYNYNVNVDGWEVSYIKTDKEEGTVKEFIEKEGKWFNYIRGKDSTLDKFALNFQGIGLAKNITV